MRFTWLKCLLFSVVTVASYFVCWFCEISSINWVGWLKCSTHKTQSTTERWGGKKRKLFRFQPFVFDFRTDWILKEWSTRKQSLDVNCCIGVQCSSQSFDSVTWCNLHDNRKCFHCAPDEIRLNQLPGGCLFGGWIFFISMSISIDEQQAWKKTGFTK